MIKTIYGRVFSVLVKKPFRLWGITLLGLPVYLLVQKKRNSTGMFNIVCFAQVGIYGIIY